MLNVTCYLFAKGLLNNVHSPFLFTDLNNPVLQAPRIMCRSRLEQETEQRSLNDSCEAKVAGMTNEDDNYDHLYKVALLQKHLNIHEYIYIYRERERCHNVYVCVYIYIYIYR